MTFPLITAHSGCMNTLDNTLHSVETGLRLGADVVEEDVRVTRDGVPVLAHDEMWRTVDGRDIHISEMTYDEIKRLTIAVPHEGKTEMMRICRLEDILPAIRESGKIINLDLKVDESIEPAAALVRKYGLTERVILSGCERERALMAQRSVPELPKLLNANSSLFVSLPYEEAVARTCRDASDARCIGININYKLVRRELLDAAAAQGLPVYVWTVNEEALMKGFIDLGVKSITTRNVQALVRLKRQLAADETSS